MKMVKWRKEGEVRGGGVVTWRSCDVGELVRWVEGG